MPNLNQSFIQSFLLCFCIFISSCGESPLQRGETYLYVADDFSEVAVESAPEMSELVAAERFIIIELDEQQQLPDEPRKVGGLLDMQEGRIVFKPYDSFRAGTTYRAIFQFNDQHLERDFYVRSLNDQSVAHVVNVYPSSPYLIQNLHRIYIGFSHPMAPGYAKDNIHFIDEYGDTVRNVFSDNSRERWFQDGKLLRLDLEPIPFFPGLPWLDSLNTRFKNFQLYKLVVENEMRDAKGRKLSNDYFKRYQSYGPIVSPAGNFRIMKTPEAGTMDSVLVTSRRSHDYLDLLEKVKLTDENGNSIPGTMEISDYESTIIFRPEKPWEKERYIVKISNYVHDLAGNNLSYTVKEWKMRQYYMPPEDSSRYFTTLSFWPVKKEKPSPSSY